VFDEPPAPAARVELGFADAAPVARRRIWAPGGLATVDERPLPLEAGERGESESDIIKYRRTE